MNGTLSKKRDNIGIIFYPSPHWMGGVSYIINVVNTLNFLSDEEKPEIFLFYRLDLSRFLADFKYPYLNLIEWDFPSIPQGYIKSWLMQKNIFVEELIEKYSLDVIYPLHDFPVRSKTKTKIISWYADLQHKYYPAFFSKLRIFGRNFRILLTLRNANDLVVSSQAVMDDFNKFYNIKKEIRIHIYNFVSIIDPLKDLRIEDLRIKYDLPEKYFLVSNQFHKHKNHKVVLLALVGLNKMGNRKHIAMTGKLPNDANSPYMSELIRIIEDNNLKDQISMLGVIPRNEQLQIMKYSQAILQPSLFEGWSTVIEDAISLQVPVIASNLPVNIEQIGKDRVYFDPNDPGQLATILADYPERNLNDVFYENYSDRIIKAANVLKKIFS